MINTFLADASLLRDVAWQSTALLLAGGIASLCWSHKPARAHRLLLLAMVAAGGTPLLSQTFRQWGWGLFLQPQAAVAKNDTLTWTLQDVETANSHTDVRLGHFAVAGQEVDK